VGYASVESAFVRRVSRTAMRRSRRVTVAAWYVRNEDSVDYIRFTCPRVQDGEIPREVGVDIEIFVSYLCRNRIMRAMLSFPSDCPRSKRITLVQLARDIRELSLLELGLPEDGIRVAEAMLDPSVLLDVVQVDEATRVGVAVGGGQNTPSPELQGLVVLHLVLVRCIEHAVCEGLTGADTEEVA
jgi:hypothetical protein